MAQKNASVSGMASKRNNKSYYWPRAGEEWDVCVLLLFFYYSDWYLSYEFITNWLTLLFQYYSSDEER